MAQLSTDDLDRYVVPLLGSVLAFQASEVVHGESHPRTQRQKARMFGAAAAFMKGEDPVEPDHGDDPEAECMSFDQPPTLSLIQGGLS
jgi:hypothetical protein